jgi:hypothetical protein
MGRLDSLPERPMTAAEREEHIMNIAEHALGIGDRLLAVAEAAKAEHDERCGCKGEACELGKALVGLRLGK